MSNTLLPGDLVLVNKLMYGPRLPNTLLFIPFTERRELSSGKYYFSWPQIPYNRMNGFSSIKNNDVLAFNYPEETEIPVDKRVVYIKRCAGLPGDNVQFKNDELFINKLLDHYLIVENYEECHRLIDIKNKVSTAK